MHLNVKEKKHFYISHLKAHDKNIRIKDYSYIDLTLRFSFPAIVFSFKSILLVFSIIPQSQECATMEHMSTTIYYYQSCWIYGTVTGAQPEIFQGRGGFVKLGHFSKHCFLISSNVINI